MAGELSIGSVVAGYRIDALISRGGMGVVYRATHLGLERAVALKVIARELAERDGFRERFLRESRLAARLDHPAVVPVYDSREVDGELIVAMRLIQGGDLRLLIDRQGPLHPARAIDLLSQVADALDAAHAAGVVHRDVKPHNVLVEGDRAYLSDFGLAKALDETGGGAAGNSVVGTAQYMSPEQWRGEVVGPAADVYSLGCVLYEALTGVVPYARAEADTEPEIPEGLEPVIRRAVARDAGDRYPTAGALIAAARARQGSEVRPTAVLSHDSSERTTVPAPPGRFGIAGRRAALWIGGGVAIIFATIALALALLLLGDAGPEVSAPVRIGDPPLHVAAGPKAAWVTSTPDRTLTRLNPNTGERVGRPIDLGEPAAGVAVGSRWIWITVPSHGEVLRVDARSGKVLAPIHLGGAPGAIALTREPKLVWVADEDGRGVAVIDAETGAVRRPNLPPHSAPLRLAAGAGGVWASIARTGRVRRIDSASFAVGAPKQIGRGPAGITVAHGLVWVANARAGEVTGYDPSHNTVEPVEVGGRPGGIDAGTETIWVANRADDTVTRIDIASAEVEGDPIAVGPDPSAVAVGGDAVWVANNGDGTVTRIEP